MPAYGLHALGFKELRKNTCVQIPKARSDGSAVRNIFTVPSNILGIGALSRFLQSDSCNSKGTISQHLLKVCISMCDDCLCTYVSKQGGYHYKNYII